MPYRNDMGYMTIAKKVTNYAPAEPVGALVSRYGLEGAAARLASGVDSSFPGTEAYTVLHIVSISGLTDLLDHAVKAIDWAVKHADYQTGPYQISDDTLNQNYYEGRKGDIDYSNALAPADYGAMLAMTFAGITVVNGRHIPLCVVDVNNSGALTPADAGGLQLRVFANITPLGFQFLIQCSH